MIGGLYLPLSFVAGSIPFAFLLGLLRGVDIRKVGSGNVGATNLARSKGKFWGYFAFFLDAGKGWLPVWMGDELLGYESWVTVASALAAISGHCFSPFLKFRGGKGVATSIGALLALSPWIALALLGVWAIALLFFKKIGLASATTALLAAIYGGIMLPITADQRAYFTFLVLLSALVLVRHKKNLKEYFLKPSI